MELQLQGPAFDTSFHSLGRLEKGGQGQSVGKRQIQDCWEAKPATRSRPPPVNKEICTLKKERKKKSPLSSPLPLCSPCFFSSQQLQDDYNIFPSFQTACDINLFPEYTLFIQASLPMSILLVCLIFQLLYFLASEFLFCSLFFFLFFSSPMTYGSSQARG